VHEHKKQNAISKQIFIDSINGIEDHIHVLFGLNADMSIAKAIQLIKGESSFWINKQKMTSSSFEWADEYYAVSVSESQLQKVRDYIANQEDHHKKKTFQEECEEFFKHYKFHKDQG
jgi:REP element-mobilizing transposase RayT